MGNTNQKPIQIAVFSDKQKLQSYEKYIFGTNNNLQKRTDTFGDALDRYMKEYNIDQKMLAEMTGIAQSTISRYIKNQRTITRKYLCAVCIALRLHPYRQEHLFGLSKRSMPGKSGYSDQVEYIIRDYMNGCAYNEKYTLLDCNDKLLASGAKALTSLHSNKEEK